MLTITDLHKSYPTPQGPLPVLRGVDLSLARGASLALMGESGSGKSTLLHLVAGLDRPDRGDIQAAGQALASLNERDLATWRREGIGLIFQQFNLIASLTVADNLAFQARLAGRHDPRWQAELAERLGLATLLERYPEQLSGGQQQRVAIARAVVNKPRLLLLDESLSALDYKLRKQMQNELKALQRKLGITFVFVTHDQEEALTMSDRIVVMRDGKIEQDGTPREIYEEPKNLFVASFIGEINIFDATVIERLDEQRVRASVEGRECNITVNFAVEAGQRLHVLLRPEDLRVDEIHHNSDADGLIGYVRERNYKGMTLESVVELENGKMVMVSEFFNEDDPDFDHSLDQKMSINWVESWEVVLADEELQ